MQQVFAVALQSMQQDMTRVQGVAMNLANIQTAGYKRQLVASRPFVDLVRNDAGDGQAAAAAAAGDTVVATDTRAGTMKLTSRSLDVALAGDGLFEVQTANGLAYTRQGSFHLDARGRLVTTHGDAVMGKAGEIVLPSSAVTIDTTGRIFDPAAANPAQPLAQLRIVQAGDGSGLRRLGDGMLALDGGAVPMEDASVQVRQGSLENSNVTSMQEMLQLMQTLRHFESMQKVAQGCDEMLGLAIRKLGDL